METIRAISILFSLLAGHSSLLNVMATPTTGINTTVPPTLYQNPVLETNQTLGDPHVIRVTTTSAMGTPITTFYMYTTAHWGIGCYASHNLIDWRPAGTSPAPRILAHGEPYTPDGVGASFFWAPAVTQVSDDEFIMFLSSTMEPDGGFKDARLRVAKSTRPDGGFNLVNTLVTDRTFIDPFYLQVKDSQGRARHYLYFATLAAFDLTEEEGPEGIWVAELENDLSRFKTKPLHLIGPETLPEDWVTEGVNEAPWVLQVSETKFIMVYSGNLFNAANYGLGYAVSTTGPLGPYRKAAENPILKNTEKVTSPGHNSFVTDDEGQLWCIYHVDNPDPLKKHARIVAIDKAEIWHEGDQFGIRIAGPTTSEQNAPYFTMPYVVKRQV